MKKSKNVLEEKRRTVEQKICIKKTNTFTLIAINFVREQLISQFGLLITHILQKKQTTNFLVSLKNRQLLDERLSVRLSNLNADNTEDANEI